MEAAGDDARLDQGHNRRFRHELDVELLVLADKEGAADGDILVPLQRESYVAEGVGLAIIQRGREGVIQLVESVRNQVRLTVVGVWRGNEFDEVGAVELIHLIVSESKSVPRQQREIIHAVAAPASEYLTLRLNRPRPSV